MVELAFESIDLDWNQYVKQDASLQRPADVETLVADASLARQELGWEPKVDFESLIGMMIDADLERLRSDSEERTGS